MKKIIIATLTAGAIAAVGGIAVATINQNQIGAPMSQEPQTIIEEPEEEIVEVEYVDTPEEADIVIEKIIDEPVEPKAEVVEPKNVEEPKAVEKDECQEFLDYLTNVYGSTNVLDVMRKGHKNISDILDRNNITEWEDFETRYLNHDVELSAIPQYVYNLAKGYAIRKAEYCQQ